MPKIKIGEKLHQIPWNPDIIAGLIFQGYSVQPDEGLDEATIVEHNRQLGARLEKLWGNKNLRSMPEKGGMDSWKNENIPEIHRAPVNRNSDFLNVVPNPYLNFQIRQVPGSTQFDPRKMIELAEKLRIETKV